jgi:23S rRNA pseudouridine1911/1915/1917 synthase
MLTYKADKTDRLDKFLATQIRNVSRSKIQKAIKDGLVLVNGKVVTEPDFPVSKDDKIELPEFKEEGLRPLDFDLKVVFENNNLAVIDKPEGLVVHPAAGHAQDTLANILISKYPDIRNIGDPHRPGIVHRLDEDTSGLLVIAKNQETFEYLKNLFKTRQIEKEYLALVHGQMEKMHGQIDTPIGKTSTHMKMKVGVGREAMTEYSVVATDPSLQFSLLKVKLHTGRTHQIRVHLASIGHPVFGDQLYGGSFKLKDLEILPRQFLHACRLKFQLSDGTWLEVESPLPDELQTVLNNLGIKYDNKL